MTKVAIVVDSLSRLLQWKTSSAICTLLHQLYSNSADVQTGIVCVSCTSNLISTLWLFSNLLYINYEINYFTVLE